MWDYSYNQGMKVVKNYLFFGISTLLISSSWCANVAVKMGIEGEEFAQTINTPEVAEMIDYQNYLQPGQTSSTNTANNGVVRPASTPRVPLAQLIPSLLIPGTTTKPTTGPGNISLNEIFLGAPPAPNATSTGSTSSTSTVPIDPVTKLIAPYDSLSFNAAFGQAMKDLGKGKAFSWRSRFYGTCYKNDTSLPYPQCQALVDEDAKIQRAKNG